LDQLSVTLSAQRAPASQLRRIAELQSFAKEEPAIRAIALVGFFDGYKETPKERLLDFMSDAPDIDELRTREQPSWQMSTRCGSQEPLTCETKQR
jgi:hypothetical protein